MLLVEGWELTLLNYIGTLNFNNLVVIHYFYTVLYESNVFILDE